MRKWQTLTGVLPLALVLSACGSSAETSETASSAPSASSAAETSAAAQTTAAADPGGHGGSLDKSWDTELTAMLEEVEDQFTRDTWSDEASGLSVPYNIYVPDGYTGDGSDPILFFIGDATTVGTDMACSLEQGWGGIVWATDAVQAVQECLVVTLVFPDVVMDDNSGSYVASEYAEFMPDIVTSIAERYGADTSRIYGTGQSMGAMTTMYVAAQNPDLYAAVLIVDGQWDISTLQGLEDVSFIYITAGGDEKATTGQTEVKEMFAADDVDYAEISDLDASLLDDADTKSEIEDAVAAMLDEGSEHNFITWTAGSVLTNYGGSGSEHIASFDYAYKLECVRDWILAH